MRPMELEDSSLIVRWRNSDRISSMSGMKNPINKEGHIKWFNSRSSLRKDFVISLSNIDNHPIGVVSFEGAVNGCGNIDAELGKYIGDDRYLGLGLAYEASVAWINFGFTSLNFESIYIRTKKNNIANIRLNTKLGFKVVDGFNRFPTLSDEWLYMEITKEEWLRLNKYENIK